MYKAFYGLSGEPFSKDLPKEQLYHSKNFQECFSRLEYVKNIKGLMLLTGDAGLGKTTLIRAFNQSLNPNFHKLIYLPLANVGKVEFYRQLNFALGGEVIFRKSDMFASIQKLMTDYAKSNITPVIIFDDAQYLKTDNLYELQQILNFQIDSYDPALVVLAGQPALRERLARPAFASIYQRFVVQSMLSPLNENETKEYILHHLKVKGRKENIFNDNALLAIFKASNGTMRMINRIVMKTLIYGVSQKIDIIDEDAVFLSANML